MTSKEKEDFKKWFFVLIGKALEKNISKDPAIIALINNVSVCLADNNSDNCKNLLNELEKLIEKYIDELIKKLILKKQEITKTTDKESVQTHKELSNSR
jgi:hypothetical protein